LGVGAELSTGDSQGRARRLGVPCATACSSPQDKARRVATQTAAGHAVLFVGDGVNDALAMAEARASLAVESGAPIAAQVADGLWDGRDPRALAFALRVCRSAVASVRASLRYALVYNSIGVVAAAAGLLHPVLAAVLMTASSLLVTWRAGHALEALDPDAPRPWPAARPGASSELAPAAPSVSTARR
jgi:P-type E1-E2 ATPase